MSKCSFTNVNAPNGKQSKLFEELYHLAGKSHSLAMINYARIRDADQSGKFSEDIGRDNNNEVLLEAVIDTDFVDEKIRYAMISNEHAVTSTVIEGIIKTLENQIESRKRELRNATSEGRRIRIQTDIEKYSNQIEQLRKDGTAEKVRAIAKESFDFVRDIFARANPKPKDVGHAISIIDAWYYDRTQNFLTEEQTADPDNVFKNTLLEISKDAQDLNNQMNNQIIDFLNNYLNKRDSDRVMDISEDMFAAMEDIGIPSRYTTSLSMSTSGIAQEYVELMQTARRNAEGQISRFADELNAAMKEIDISRILDTTESGAQTGFLVAPFDGSFFSMTANTMRTYRQTVEKIMKGRYKEGQTKQGALDAAYNRYIKQRSSNEVAIDPRMFFKEMNTEMSEQEYRESLYEQADAQTESDRQIIDSIINDSIVEYNRYRAEKAAYKESMEAATYDDYVSTRLQNEDGSFETRAEWVQRKVRDWDYRHDPIRFVEDMKDPSGLRYSVNQGWNNTKTIPKAFNKKGDSTGFYSSDFKKLTEAEKEARAHLIEALHRIREMLPAHMTNDQNINLIPTITKNLTERLLENDLAKNMGDLPGAIIDLLTDSDMVALRQQKEVVEDNPFQFIEPREPNYIFDQTIDVSERTFNIERAMTMAFSAAVMYHSLDQISDVANIMLDLVKKSNVIDPSTGEVTENTPPKELLGAMEHTAHALIGGRKRQKEMQTNVRMSRNRDGVWKTMFRQNKVRTALSNLETKDRILNEAMEEGTPIPSHVIDQAIQSINKLKKVDPDNLKYSDDQARQELINKLKSYQQLERTTDEVADAKLETAKLRAYEIITDALSRDFESYDARNLNIAKALDNTLVKFAQIQGLGWNLRAGITNALFGLLSASMHAAGQQDFTAKQFREAVGIMMGAMNPTNTKVAAMIKRDAVLFEVKESSYGMFTREQLKDKDIRYRILSSNLGIWEIQKRTEFFSQGLSYVAKALATPVVDLEGNVRNYYEAHDADGNWKTEEFGDSPEWRKDLQGDEINKYAKFRNSTLQLNKYLHGDYDPNSTMEIKSYVVGRLVMMFKTWIPANVVYRYSGEFFDKQLGRQMKGIHKSAWDVYSQHGTTGFLQTMKAAFQKNFEGFTVNNNPVNEVDVRNMAIVLKQMYLWSVLTGTMMALAALVKSSPDDEPFDRPARAIMNQIYRLRQDIEFYVHPGTMVDVVRNPTPVINLAEDFFKLLNDTYQYMEDPDWQGDGPVTRLSKTLPLTRQYHNILFALDEGVPGGVKKPE